MRNVDFVLVVVSRDSSQKHNPAGCFHKITWLFYSDCKSQKKLV
jgi:hypothetical protein